MGDDIVVWEVLIDIFICCHPHLLFTVVTTASHCHSNKPTTYASSWEKLPHHRQEKANQQLPQHRPQMSFASRFLHAPVSCYCHNAAAGTDRSHTRQHALHTQVFFGWKQRGIQKTEQHSASITTWETISGSHDALLLKCYQWDMQPCGGQNKDRNRRDMTGGIKALVVFSLWSLKQCKEAKLRNKVHILMLRLTETHWKHN